MGFTHVRRSGIVGAMVAALLGALIVFVPTPAAAAGEWVCHGNAIQRCATVWWDRANDTYYARAKVVDPAGGGDYNVWVNDVKLLNFTGDRLVTVRSNPDRDGMHDVKDLARTSAVDPCDFSVSTFQVKATFYWRGPGNNQETWTPKHSWAHVC